MVELKQLNALNPQRSIGTVLAEFCKSPQLLRSTDISLSADDFLMKFHKILFNAINNIIYSNASLKSINEADIDNYLSSFPKYYAIWSEHDGITYLNQSIKYSKAELFETSLQEVKKYSLLRRYVANGVDISDLYDFNNVDPEIANKGAETIDSMTIDEITNHYTSKILAIRNDITSETGTDIVQFEIKDDIDTLLERLNEVPEMGHGFTNPYFNTLFRGMREGKYMLRSAGTNVGKAVTLNTHLKMADGTDKLAKDIKVGDIVLGQDGKPTNITGVFPHKNKKMYKVSMSDGRSFEACDEHLVPVWTTGQKTNRRGNVKYLQTKVLGDMIRDYKNTNRHIGNRVITTHKYLLPLNEKVEYPEVKHVIDPYALGVLLAEGSLHDIVTNGMLRASFNEDDVLERFMEKSGFTYYTHGDYNYSYAFNQRENDGVKGYKDEIKHYDLAHTTKSKYIPNDYLYDSIENRMELLKGLIDTDGSICMNKSRDNYCVGFATISEKLKNTFLELVDGLGFGRSVKLEHRTDRKCNDLWDIKVFTPEKIWTSEKHSKRAESRKYKSNKHIYTQIIDIQRIEDQDAVCFSVDNKDHLFLIDNYVVTHNTRMGMADMLNVACDEIYETGTGNWVKTGKGYPILFISTELDKNELQTIALAYISGLETSEIEAGDFDKTQLLRLKKAVEVLKRSKMFFVYMEDFSVTDLEMIIEDHIINYGIKYCVFDYIQNNGKMSKALQEEFGHAMREDEIILNLSKKLKVLSTKYDVFMMSATQLNAKETDPDNRVSKGVSSLRGAKATADKVDYGIITTNITAKDLKALEPIMKKGFNKAPNVGHWIYKNRAGLKSIVVWSYYNMGNMREEPLFVTDYDYNKVDLAKTAAIDEDGEQGEIIDF